MIGTGVGPRRNVGFFRREAADTDRGERAAEIDHAAHRAGVAVRRAVIFVAQVGVGVEVQDPEIGVALLAGRDRAARQRMFAAEQEREFARIEEVGGRLRTRVDHLGGGTELRFEGVGREDADLGRFTVEVGIVEFDLAGSVDDRPCSVPRTSPV